MRTRVICAAAALLLTSCGSITLPAAVRMNSGEVLMGTTTAALSGGTFSVSTPTGHVVCTGNYDALDTSPTISAPVRCNDGRYGTITVTRAPSGRAGAGTVSLADGTSGTVAFGTDSTSVVANNSQPEQGAYAGASPSYLAGSYPPAPSYSSYSSSQVYTGNCPTPESLDAAGRRCGGRSAASRPGGYDGYGTWSASSYRPSGGSTFVGGYYRKNGTYVRSHYRRR